MIVDISKVKESIINMFEINMGLKDGESVLVLTDYPHGDLWSRLSVEELNEALRRSFLARIVYEVGKEAFSNCRFTFKTYPMTGMHGAEPPKYVAEAMKGADVVIAITTYSLSHTRAREEACKAGARIASMPGFTPEMFEPEGPMAVDYLKVKELCESLVKVLRGGNEVRVRTDYGTDLRFSIKDREWGVDTGLYVNPGDWGNLPAGEVYIAPLEGTGEGTVVIPRGWYSGLKEDLILKFSKGLVVEVEGGGDVGRKLRELLGLEPRVDDEVHRVRRNLAELGIGTNPKAKRPDNVLEAEKILGTVHIAIGDNSHLGGNTEADLHEDFVIPKPTLEVDGRLVMKNGELIIK